MEQLTNELTELALRELDRVSKITPLIMLLGDPLPSEAIQRTKDGKTHKGYDTDGYGYQFCVNRLNEIFGNNWGFFWEIINDAKGTSKSGTTMFDITVKVNIWLINPGQPRSCIGGHISRTYADALKGAITNGFKKTAAFWGVGRHAYEGALDDDNDPWPEWAAQNGSEPSPTMEDIKESFHGKQNQQARQPEPPAPPKNGNGHKSSQQNGNGHDSSQQNEQAPSAPPAGNGKEAGLRRRIKAKLEMVCERSEDKMNKWLTDNFSSTLKGLESLNAERLQYILNGVEDAFEAWKSGK